MGSWAQYTSSRDGQDFTSRIALVGQEKRDGKDALWFESTSETPRGKMISEVLVPGYPYAPDAVMEVVMKRGDQPAMKMSGSMMASMRGQGGQGASAPAGQAGMARGGRGGGMGRGGAMSNWTEQCRSLTVVGQESVKVPAGTFTATHLRNAADSTDVWVSRDVPFGMVKSQTPARNHGADRHGQGCEEVDHGDPPGHAGDVMQRGKTGRWPGVAAAPFLLGNIGRASHVGAIV